MVWEEPAADVAGKTYQSVYLFKSEVSSSSSSSGGGHVHE